MKPFAPLLMVLLVCFAGCAQDSGPLRAKWEYVELLKDENGQDKEIGDKHTLRSGGDEMVEIREKRLEVVTVTSAKAKFRLSGSDAGDTQEVEIQPGSSQDLWLGSFGVRLRVEKIAPIQAL